MTTIRTARVKCPHCKKTFIVRDNGGMSAQEADKVWASVDEVFVAVDAVFNKVGKLFRRK